MGMFDSLRFDDPSWQRALTCAHGHEQGQEEWQTKSLLDSPILCVWPIDADGRFGKCAAGEFHDACTVEVPPLLPIYRHCEVCDPIFTPLNNPRRPGRYQNHDVWIEFLLTCVDGRITTAERLRQDHLIDAFSTTREILKEHWPNHIDESSEKYRELLARWRKPMSDEWEKIGEVAIDSGTIALVDACHLRKGASENLEAAWEKWRTPPLVPSMQVKSGAGVNLAVFQSTSGDAMLEVLGRRNAKGIIRVKFPWAEAMGRSKGGLNE